MQDYCADEFALRLNWMLNNRPLAEIRFVDRVLDVDSERGSNVLSCFVFLCSLTNSVAGGEGERNRDDSFRNLGEEKTRDSSQQCESMLKGERERRRGVRWQTVRRGQGPAFLLEGQNWRATDRIASESQHAQAMPHNTCYVAQRTATGLVHSSSLARSTNSSVCIRYGVTPPPGRRPRDRVRKEAQLIDERGREGLHCQ